MKKILYVAVFCLTFIITDSLFNKHDVNINLGDQLEKSVAFNEVTVEGNKIVLKENSNLYYVAYFDNDTYKVYSYMFLNNKEEYLEKYIQYNKNIVDYDYDNYMIKVFINEGYENFDKVINLLKSNSYLEIIY